MNRVIEQLLNEVQLSDFRKWQNELAQEAQNTLEHSNSNNDNEVAIVTQLCEKLNKKNRGQMHLYAKKIHGNRSTVEFYDGANKLVTKEMADMVVISLATINERIVFEKIAFIQNKKEKDKDKWDIEQSQLYLLHNLPTFDGKSGIFKHSKKVAFPNTHGRLGNYGLFNEPCNMIFANARIITALQKGSIVSLDDIKSATATLGNTSRVPFLDYDSNFMHYGLYCISKHGYKSFFTENNGIPVLGDCAITLNMHQFMRNWTQFNIGEVIISHGKTRCKPLTDLSRAYKRAAGFEDLYKFDFDDTNDNENTFDWASHDANAAVMVMHFELKEQM